MLATLTGSRSHTYICPVFTIFVCLRVFFWFVKQKSRRELTCCGIQSIDILMMHESFFVKLKSRTHKTERTITPRSLKD